MRNLEVILAVIWALRTAIKHFEKWIEKLDLELTIKALQKPCLLVMARIIQKVMDVKWKKNEATISKTTGWCPLLWHFYQQTTLNLKVKEIITETATAIIILIICWFDVENETKSNVGFPTLLQHWYNIISTLFHGGISVS